MIDVARTFVINVITRLVTWLTSNARFRVLWVETAIPRASDIVIAVLIPIVPKTDTAAQRIFSNMPWPRNVEETY